MNLLALLLLSLGQATIDVPATVPEYHFVRFSAKLVEGTKLKRTDAWIIEPAPGDVEIAPDRLSGKFVARPGKYRLTLRWLNLGQEDWGDAIAETVIGDDPTPSPTPPDPDPTPGPTPEPTNSWVTWARNQVEKTMAPSPNRQAQAKLLADSLDSCASKSYSTARELREAVRVANREALGNVWAFWDQYFNEPLKAELNRLITEKKFDPEDQQALKAIYAGLSKGLKEVSP